MVNFTEAIKKPFTNLTKLVIGIVLSLIPIVQWIAKGFALESSGVGKARPSPKMPEWKNYWNLFIKGLLADVILFIYMLPALIVFLIATGIVLAPLVSSIVSSALPQEILQAAQPTETGSSFLKNLIQQNWMLILPSLIVAAPIFIVGFILFLFATYVGPMAVLNYVRTNKFDAAFKFSLVFRKTLNRRYFVVWLLTMILIGIVAALLNWIPFIGKALVYFITGVMSFSIYGQIYREIK